MPFREWLFWVRSKPFHQAWFIFFLFLRPIAEQFYNLKEISPLISPLYWLGILTLILSLTGIMYGHRSKTRTDRLFLSWTFLVLLSLVMMFISTGSLLSYLSFATKLALPVVIYFFLRVFIKNKTDLIGLVTTFLFSCFFPIAILLIGLLRGVLLTGERFEGLYADVFNNAFYLSVGLISLLYLFIHSRAYQNTIKISFVHLLVALIVIILGLWGIKHLATIVVIIAILGIFIYIVFNKYRSSSILLFVLSLTIVAASGEKFYQEVLDPRIEKEVEVMEGAREISQGVHGRMSRWMWLSKEFQSAPVFAQVAGYPLSLRYANYMVGITPHNDFLRILFFTGYAGLLIYLLIIYKVFRNAWYKDIQDRFFIYAVMFSTILYSLTTVPTFYPGFINIMMIAVAYSTLPPLIKWNAKK